MPDVTYPDDLSSSASETIEAAVDNLAALTIEDRTYAMDESGLPADSRVRYDDADLPYVVDGERPMFDEFAVATEFRAFCPECDVYFDVESESEAADAWDDHRVHHAVAVVRRAVFESELPVPEEASEENDRLREAAIERADAVAQAVRTSVADGESVQAAAEAHAPDGSADDVRNTVRGHDGSVHTADYARIGAKWNGRVSHYKDADYASQAYDAMAAAGIDPPVGDKRVGVQMRPGGPVLVENVLEVP